MRWKNTETPTFPGSAGSNEAPAVTDRMALYDRDGNEVGYFEKTVAGVFSLTIGDVVLTTTAVTVGGVAPVLQGAATVVLDLPTADPEVEGQLWNDTGVVTVSAGA